MSFPNDVKAIYPRGIIINSAAFFLNDHDGQAAHASLLLNLTMKVVIVGAGASDLRAARNVADNVS